MPIPMQLGVGGGEVDSASAPHALHTAVGALTTNSNEETPVAWQADSQVSLTHTFQFDETVIPS